MATTKTATKWEVIGLIGVDAGLCWVGDPCYILHRDSGDSPDDIGRTWDEFCEQLRDQDTRQFDFNMGHAGLGVCLSTGYGDGNYDVEVRRNSEGRIAEMRVRFIEEDD
jgi:hypothetical protein